MTSRIKKFAPRQTTQRTPFQQFPYCCVLISSSGNVSTTPLPSNGDLENAAYSVVASVTIAAEKCLPCRYLAMTVSTRSSIPAFNIMSQYHILWKYKMMWNIGF
jgi:hypothetical protein